MRIMHARSSTASIKINLFLLYLSQRNADEWRAFYPACSIDDCNLLVGN